MDDIKRQRDKLKLRAALVTAQEKKEAAAMEISTLRARLRGMGRG
ncbi:MAG: hypothetical protein ACWGPR_12250 [Candidatus Deferrimicrobiaceae bacterium]